MQNQQRKNIKKELERNLTKVRFVKGRNNVIFCWRSCRGDEKHCEEKQFEDHPSDLHRSRCCCDEAQDGES